MTRQLMWQICQLKERCRSRHIWQACLLQVSNMSMQEMEEIIKCMSTTMAKDNLHESIYKHKFTALRKSEIYNLIVGMQ